MKAAWCLLLLAACSGSQSPRGTTRTIVPAALGVAPAPISFDGDVAGRPTDLVFVLVPDAAPETPGVALAAGDTLQIALPAELARTSVAIEPSTDRNLVLTKGWPQGAIPAAGRHEVGVLDGLNVVTVTVLAPIETTGPLAPGLKALHLRGGTFTNPAAGTYPMMIELLAPDGSTRQAWEGSLVIRATPPAARIAPTNFHVPPGVGTNFQRVAPGAIAPRLLGLLLWGEGGTPLDGVGIAPRDLAREPRYTGGLLVQDTNGDGALDPAVDRIVGGIIGAAPEGAKGQAARSPLRPDGGPLLSGQVLRDPGFPQGGGAPVPGLLAVEFQAGNLPGVYRPTFELVGGNSVQLAIVVTP